METRDQTTVLIVDDEPSILKLISLRLKSWDYRVLTAENGKMGMAMLESHRPDLVITDLFMPEVDGFEFLAHIHEHAPALPVIVLSGQGRLGDAIRALRLGAWDYIYKPIEESEFLRIAIEKVLEKARLIEENHNYRDHLERMLARKSDQLVASEKRYRTVADFTYNWEYWIDSAGKMEYISPSCERITGFAPSAFIQDPSLLHDLVHPEDRALFIGNCEDRQLNEKIFETEFRIIRRDGQERWIGHSCQPVHDPEGLFLGRRCSNRDITYQKKIETDLKTKQKQLIEKTVSLEKANEALKALLDQRETEKRSIEQTMVNNLKRFVFPYVESLSEMKLGKEAKTYLEIIQANIDQLVSPVSRTLSGAYLDFTPTEIRVADLIRQGESSKSIADVLNTSTSTVAIHRNNIRKKLGILNQKVNLRTFLNSLA